jgi:hypothetical protein
VARKTGFRVLTAGGEDISGHVTLVNVKLDPREMPTATIEAIVKVHTDPETDLTTVTIGGR